MLPLFQLAFKKYYFHVHSHTVVCFATSLGKAIYISFPWCFLCLKNENQLNTNLQSKIAAPFIVAHAQNTKAFKKVSNLFISHYFDIIKEIRNLITCDQSPRRIGNALT